MTNLMHSNFVFFSTMDILCLSIGTFILKKYVRKFPHKLIPIFNVMISTVLTWLWALKEGHACLMYIQIGFCYGLSSVGLHQLIKQTNNYIRICKYKKQKRKAHSEHIITMSD